MKILFVSTVHPSPAAPTKGTFNRVLLDSLRDVGHDVRALVPVPWREAGLSRLRDAPHVSYARFWYPPGIAPTLLDRFLALSIRRAVANLTRGWKPDIVVGYWAHPDGTVAVRIAAALGTPAVVMTGGSDVQLLAMDRHRRPQILDTLTRADLVITIGEGLRQAVQRMGIPDHRVKPFHRGVDRGTFHPGDRADARRTLGLPESGAHLLWVGRMVPVKGLDILLEAFASLSTPGVRLYLVGTGPEEAVLRTTAARLKIAERIIFVGSVSHEALGNWYRSADLTVLPSRSEGIPNVLLESLACGTRFVGSRVGGIPDLAESPEWLVQAGDAEDLARVIDRMLHHPAVVAGEAEDDRGAALRFAALLTETVAEVHRQ